MAKELDNTNHLDQFIAELDSPYINKVDTHASSVKLTEKYPAIFLEKLQSTQGLSVKKYCLYELLTVRAPFAKEPVKASESLLRRLQFWKKESFAETEFKQLDEMVFRAEMYIRNCGVSCGEVVALVDLTGIPLLVYVLAVLKVGGKFTILTTQSKTVFDTRVSYLTNGLGKAPALKLIVNLSNVALLNKSEENDSVMSKEEKQFAFEYDADLPACITFDEETGQDGQPWFLSAKELYESILVNGVCLFGSKQTGKLVIPENCKTYYHCSLMLTSLVYGVTPVFQSLETESAIDNLSYLLFEESNKKRYLILLDSWPFDLSASVSNLLAKLGNQDIDTEHIFRVRYSNVLFGITLLSKWYKDGKVKNVIPTPGREFSLTNPLLINQRTNNGQGLLSYKRANGSDHISNDLVTSTGFYYVYQEWSTPRVEDTLYPEQSTIYSLSCYLTSTFKGWLWADVMMLPAHLAKAGEIKLLVLYIDGRMKEQQLANVDHSKLTHTIISWFKSSTLECFSPTKKQIDCAFYYPKNAETSETLIQHWLSGELVKKSNLESFRAISLLRKKLKSF